MGRHSVGARDAHELKDNLPGRDVACAFAAAAAAAPSLSGIERKRRVPGRGIVSCPDATAALHCLAPQPHVPARNIFIRGARGGDGGGAVRARAAGGARSVVSGVASDEVDHLASCSRHLLSKCRRCRRAAVGVSRCTRHRLLRGEGGGGVGVGGSVVDLGNIRLQTWLHHLSSIETMHSLPNTGKNRSTGSSSVLECAQ